MYRHSFELLLISVIRIISLMSIWKVQGKSNMHFLLEIVNKTLNYTHKFGCYLVLNNHSTTYQQTWVCLVWESENELCITNGENTIVWTLLRLVFHSRLATKTLMPQIILYLQCTICAVSYRLANLLAKQRKVITSSDLTNSLIKINQFWLQQQQKK